MLLLLLLVAGADGVAMVTPLLRAGRAEEARALTAIDYNGVSYGNAGHFTVAAEHIANRSNHIYTWFQPCHDVNCDSGSEDTPLLVWLQGGPGGPGWFGAFAEIGNWYVGGNSTDGEPHERCFSWCLHNNCIFVDQPVQSGFSFQTDDVTGEAVTDVSKIDFTDTSHGAMAQVLSVLLQVYEMVPELAAAPLIVAGESYGGLYTPNLAYLILQHNDAQRAASAATIDFKALVVGDPAIAWARQMPTYPDTLYGMGVIMLDEKADLAQRMAASVSMLDSNCSAAFALWNEVWDDNGGLGPSTGHGWFAQKTGSFNTENVLLGNSPVGWEFLSTFWAKDAAQLSFHVDGVPAPSDAALNSLMVYDAFVASSDWCTPSSGLYARVLVDSEVDVIIYSSTSDPLLGPPTTEAAVGAVLDDAEAYDATKGGGLKAAFLAAAKAVWFVDSAKDTSPAGYARCAARAAVGSGESRFCYAVVRNAGHETPGYQPRAAYDLLTRFLDRSRAWDKSGDRAVPVCSECSGVGPFAGSALPECESSSSAATL